MSEREFVLSFFFWFGAFPAIVLFFLMILSEYIWRNREDPKIKPHFERIWRFTDKIKISQRTKENIVIIIILVVIAMFGGSPEE